MKFVFALLFVLALTAAVTAKTQSWGNAANARTLLFKQKVYRAAASRQTLTVPIAFPAQSQTNNKTITYIQVTDNFRNQTGGVTTLLRGGVGYRFVDLNIRGQYQAGINSTVSIYGK